MLVLQKILSLSGLRGQNILLLCHYTERKRIMDDQLAIFVFLLCSFSSSTLFVYSVRAICICSSSSLFLVNFKRPYRPGISTKAHLSRLQWIRLDANILETMQETRNDAAKLKVSFSGSETYHRTFVISDKTEIITLVFTHFNWKVFF